ncbi:hypothetical protein SAMN05428642_101832 [Flaviramulus basaltis]|uniref:Uncharacterized protein n=1 Tax=Flaviramulus basaltis TaxID=369401 RepID=A0A1K2ICU8_9FLAO|nr:hypothetical protein [Flaviramulus basaltis]SFZ90260.1 hypothetical protein SAMN05428642_101832 [Flaviramulus basaltis]
MIIFFEELQSDFLSRSNVIANKKLYIQDELKQIDTFFNHQNFNVTTNNLFDNINNSYKPKIETIKKVFSEVKYGWDTFIKAYEHYYYNGKEIKFIPFEKGSDITQLQNDRFNERYEKYHIQGLEFGKYVLWLKEPEIKQNGKSNPSYLSHKQKLLALQYLGLNLVGIDDTKAGFVLSKILDLDETNTRKYIPKIYHNSKDNDVRTKRNFEKLLKLFENEQFEDVSKKIEQDINSLK